MSTSATPRAESGDPLEDIAARVAQGDPEAFAVLYDRTSPKAYRLARALTVGQDRAEELLRTAYAVAWRRAAELARPDERALSWVLAIVRDTARAG